MRRAMVAAAPLLALAALLGACGPNPPKQEKVEARVEEACKLPGLTPALRETTILIDRSAIDPAEPSTFRQVNARLFDIVTGLGTAQRALESGAMAPRERLTVKLVDPGSGASEQVFTGCLPGLTEAELAARGKQGEDGAVDQFFGRDMASTLNRQREAFLNKLIIAVVNAPVAPRARGGDDFAGSGLNRLIRAIGAGADRQDVVRRVILYANPAGALGSLPTAWQAAREAGFKLAADQGGDLGLAEVYLVPSKGEVSDVQRAFLDAYILGSKADLVAAGPFTPDRLSKPPVALTRFAGDIRLQADGNPAPLTLRLATTADQRLVGSWITYAGSRGLRSTPLAGQFICAEDSACQLRGDPGLTLGQRWRTEPGTAVQVMADQPFAGMRDITASGDSEMLKGKISDPIIRVIGLDEVQFTARRSN